MKHTMRHNKWSCKLKVPWRLQTFTLHYGNTCHRLQGLRSRAVQFFFLPVSRLRNQVITACPKMFGTGVDSFFGSILSEDVPSARIVHLLDDQRKMRSGWVPKENVTNSLPIGKQFLCILGGLNDSNLLEARNKKKNTPSTCNMTLQRPGMCRV